MRKQRFRKSTKAVQVDRYEAAIRLEKARRIARELTRCGMPISSVEQAEIHTAEQEYDAATAALR